MSKAVKVVDMKVAATGGEGANGVMSFWNDVARAEYAKVAAAWAAAGLKVSEVPSWPDPEVALRAALKVCGQAKAKVVKRPGKGEGFVLVDLKRFDDRNMPMAANRIVARAIGDDIVLTDEHGAASTDTDCERIRGEYQAIRRELSAAQFSAWFTSLVESCEGVRLRDGGGLYWVRKQHAERWKSYCAAIGEATGSRFSNWPTYGSDGEVIADIMLSLEREARKMAEDLQAELAKAIDGTKKLGVEALETRRALVSDFLGKLGSFAEQVGAPSRITVQLVSKVQTNLASVLRFADGVAAGRDMSAPRLLELDDMPVKPKTADELAVEMAQDPAVKRMALVEIDESDIVEEESISVEPVKEEVKPASKPFRYTPPAVTQADGTSERFRLIELD